jgi:hypothetical protein
VSDRISLIARVGARLQLLEEAGEEATAAVLRDALEQLVADASIAAAVEEKKAKDRVRKANAVPRNPRNSSVSADSADSAESQDAETGGPPAHITRALDFEDQEQDQKQKQEIANAISPDLASGNGRNPSRRGSLPEIPPSGALELAGDDPPPDPPFFDPDLIFGVGEERARRASATTVRRAVDHVVRHFVTRHPRRRPGEKDRKLIARHLRTYTPRELCDAIDGNAGDEWAQRVGKHELSWTLRDNGKIDDYRAKAERITGDAERITDEIESTGWLPSEASR